MMDELFYAGIQVVAVAVDVVAGVVVLLLLVVLLVVLLLLLLLIWSRLTLIDGLSSSSSKNQYFTQADFRVLAEKVLKEILLDDEM